MTEDNVAAYGTSPACCLSELGEKDLGALLTLEHAEPSTPWSDAQWAAALAGERSEESGVCVLGIWSEQQLAGHAVLVNLGVDAELQAIMVAPAWRRCGVGQQLLGGVIEKAAFWASERLLLEVRESNVAALALYYQAGFVLDGMRKNYYPPIQGGNIREDACLMSLCLA